MLPVIYKVKELKHGLLSVMAKPVSGEWVEDEFTGLKSLGVDKVVCLLEGFEQIEVGLELEEALCIKNNMEFALFPIPDRGLPDTQKASEFVAELYAELCAGKHIVIHCRAGIGRTGIIAGGVLVKSGMTSAEALALISSARGVQVPDTEEQVQWLGGFSRRFSSD